MVPCPVSPSEHVGSVSPVGPPGSEAPIDRLIQAAIASSMSEAAYAVRAEDGIIVYARPGLAAMFGYAPGEMVGRHVAVVNAPGDVSPEQRASEIMERLATHGVWQGEVENLRKGGEHFWSRATVTTLEHPTHGMLYVSVHTDITAEKRAEEGRQQLAERLHQAVRLESLGLLAGGVAHDFNNLLTVVLGNVDFACSSPSADAVVRARLDAAREALMRAADLADQMLVYAGRGRMAVALLDLNLLLQETAALLAPKLGAATLRLRLDEQLPRVQGDVTQLRRVVINLLTNAAEALRSHGGTITLTTRVRVLTEPETVPGPTNEPLVPGTYVRLTVRDDGRGMEQDHLDRVFDPFVTTKFAGRGLGLPVVLGVVRAHRGAVRVTSAPGEGSCFDVLLPCDHHDADACAVAPALPLPGPSADWSPGGTVLVIDDEPLVREVVTAMLEGAGVPTVQAVDGPEGLVRYQERRAEIGAILLDLTMPDMGGAEVCSRLRALGADVPIVLCSGYTVDEPSAAAGMRVADGFLRKPFIRDQLLGALHAAFEVRRSVAHR